MIVALAKIVLVKIVVLAKIVLVRIVVLAKIALVKIVVLAVVALAEIAIVAHSIGEYAWIVVVKGVVMLFVRFFDKK